MRVEEGKLSLAGRVFPVSMRVLVTVGSTRFDALVETALSQPVLSALSQKGYSDIVIQCGNSRVDELGTTDVEGIVHKGGLDVKVWRFKPSLDEEYDAADLVIGHAGLSHSPPVLAVRSKPRARPRLRDDT
jgi:UDP-N-acetylglucosamine transferase subunit ALG13